MDLIPSTCHCFLRISRESMARYSPPSPLGPHSHLHPSLRIL
jgi:hypothetical protein